MSRRIRDEHAAYERPSGRSRPRTKDRPDYSALPLGRVVGIDRGRYTCVLDEGHVELYARKARALGRKAAIVGDVVRLDGDVSGAEGTLARIVEVEERRTILRRTADDDDPYERPIVANADQLVIVTALADPPPRQGMIDRMVIAASVGGLKPILCLTKADLASPDELRAAYEPLNIPVVATIAGEEPQALESLLQGKVSVLVGHSGVGKSTLINALVPGINRAIGEVNEVTGRGRHTSTSALAIPLPDGAGWVIDTPGVRSFGLNHVSVDDVIAAFDGLAEAIEDCPRGCLHTATEPECGLDAAVARGDIDPHRLTSLRRVITCLRQAEKSY